MLGIGRCRLCFGPVRAYQILGDSCNGTCAERAPVRATVEAVFAGGRVKLRAEAAGVKTATFETSDMENVEGAADIVSCIDVMIHYPTDKMVGLVDKLASLSDEKIYVSFAPKTPQLAALKKIGSLFPGPSKATRAYLHKEEDVIAALAKNGFKVDRKHLTSQNFYFSLLLEASK